MRVYFISYTPAILKLNGAYAGGVDLFERSLELSLEEDILAEVVPGENLQPVNFFVNSALFERPPDFMDVYLSDGAALISIRRYESRQTRLNVLFQTRFEGNLITLFSQGETYLSVEGREYCLTPLGARFKSVRAEQKSINGHPVLSLTDGGYMLIISHTGGQIFSNEVISAEFGGSLKVVVKFATCTAAEAHCEYSYDGKKLTLVSSRTVETRAPDEKTMHFAFFESVLTYGDCAKYLSPELAPRAKELKGYLGNFTGVTVPTATFYERHPDERAAGLIYTKSANLFEIKYFAVQLVNGKIDNIYPVL